MVLGDAQHVADHDHGQAVREVAHDVHPALVDDTVELLVDDLRDARAHVGDAASGESLVHQPAETRMVGRVEHKHGVGKARDRRLVHAVRAAIAALHVAHEVLAEALVA
jgi:hypothetical protein